MRAFQETSLIYLHRDWRAVIHSRQYGFLLYFLLGELLVLYLRFIPTLFLIIFSYFIT